MVVSPVTNSMASFNPTTGLTVPPYSMTVLTWTAGASIAPPPVATAAPVISNVTAGSLTGTSAVITWTTDQSSTSQVEYGTTTAYGSVSAIASTLVTSHSVTLSGLNPGVAYNYLVFSANVAGQSSTSTNFTFSTPSAIAHVGGAGANTGPNLGTTSLTINYTSGGHNTLVAVCALGNIQSSISSITDGGSAWALRAFTSNAAGVRSEIWSTDAGLSVASKSFKVAISGDSPASCALEEYSGVLALGNTATGQATSGTWSIGLTTQDSNNYVAAGIGANSYYGYSNPSGTIRQSGGITTNAGVNYVEMDLFDNTAATPSLVASGVITASAPWAGVALELRSVAGSGTGPVISAVTSSGITSTSATITWVTDQASTSQVAYGATTSYGSFSANTLTLATAHSVTLAGLTPGTTYEFAVLSANASGTLTTSASFSFSTQAAAPIISAVASSGITSTSATITWVTDQASTSQVAYGATTSYGSFSANTLTLATAHSVTLAGLTPGTTYEFAVLSANASGTLATSASFSFSTQAAAPIISAVTSSGITSTSATITWVTNQPSTSQVAYGTTTAYAFTSQLNSSPVSQHTVTVTGLTPGATYDYAVMSGNSAGTTTSGNYTFSTPISSTGTQITHVGGAGGNTGSNLAPTSLTINYSSSSHNTLVAVCALGNPQSSISSIRDGGSVWALRAFTSNAAGVRSEIWSTGAGLSVASKSFTIGISAGSPASCALEEYSGVVALGGAATTQATSGTWSIGLTTQDSNNYVVAGIGANSYYGYSNPSGTIRQSGGTTANSGVDYVEMDLFDSTATMPSLVASGVITGSAPWAAAALELRVQ